MKTMHMNDYVPVTNLWKNSKETYLQRITSYGLVRWHITVFKDNFLFLVT